MAIHKPYWITVILILVVAGCGAPILARPTTTPHPHQQEMEEVVERYMTTRNEAYLSLDKSLLSQVAIDPLLGRLYPKIDTYMSGLNSSFTIDDFKITDVEVLSYSNEIALVEVRFDYKTFSYFPETRERHYGASGNWHWRKVQLTLVREDNTWKVSDSEFIDWGGY